jgi:aryl-alcohol dehydrogenase-like predicted oxidoreductase
MPTSGTLNESLALEYRTLGKTGVNISEIGFGCGNTAGLLTGGTPEDQRAAVQRALDVGINYFDTAPNYGERVFTRGASEANLGRVLKELDAHPLIGTKIELHTHHLADIGGSIAQSVDESLERLGIDTADILYLHNRVAEDRGDESGGSIGGRLSLRDVLGPKGVLEAFSRQRSEGKIRFLAFCSSGGDPKANQEVVTSGGFDVVQLSYNILEPTEGRTPPPGFSGRDEGQTIDLAGEHGLGVVVIRVLSGGVLSGAPEPHPLNTGSAVQRQYSGGAARAANLRFLEHDGDQTMAQAAIRYALNKPQVSTVLVGFSEAAQIEEAARASGQAPFPEDDLRRIESLYATAFTD